MEIREYPRVGETLISTVLSCGLPVFVVRKPGFKSAYAALNVKYGSCDQKFTFEGRVHETPPGTAHFLEHKMFDLPLPDGNVINALTILSASGAAANAVTNPDITSYYFTASEGFEQSLQLLLGSICTPYFTPDTVAKEQPIILQEAKGRMDSPAVLGSENILSLLHPYHPIRFPAVGTPESIKQINADTLALCHRAFYTPENMVLVAVGDLEPERIFELAEGCYTLKRGETPLVDYGKPEPAFPQQRFIESKTAAVGDATALFGCTFKLPYDPAEAMRKQFIAGIALQCVCGTLTDFFNRMYNRGAFKSLQTAVSKYPGGAYASGSVSANNPQKVVGLFLKELKKVAANGVDPLLFERCRRIVTSSIISSYDNISSLGSIISNEYLSGQPLLNSLEVNESLTPDEATEFLRSELIQEKFVVSLVKPMQKMTLLRKAKLAAKK